MTMTLLCRSSVSRPTATSACSGRPTSAIMWRQWREEEGGENDVCGKSHTRHSRNTADDFAMATSQKHVIVHDHASKFMMVMFCQSICWSAAVLWCQLLPVFVHIGLISCDDVICDEIGIPSKELIMMSFTILGNDNYRIVYARNSNLWYSPST